MRPYSCWFYILNLIYILLLHFTRGSESTTVISILSWIYIYIYIYIYTYIYLYIYNFYIKHTHTHTHPHTYIYISYIIIFTFADIAYCVPRSNQTVLFLSVSNSWWPSIIGGANSFYILTTLISSAWMFLCWLHMPLLFSNRHCYTVHPPPPSSINHHPALCNILNIIKAKISHLIGQFPQIQAGKFKVIRFDWKLAHMVFWCYWFQIWT